MSSIASSTLYITSQQENYSCENLLKTIESDNGSAVENFISKESGTIIKGEDGVPKFTKIVYPYDDEASYLIYAISKKCLNSAKAILVKCPELALVPSKTGTYPINYLLMRYMEIPDNGAIYPFMVVKLFENLSEACLNTRLIDNEKYFKGVLEDLSESPYLAQELCPTLKKIWLEHKKDEIKMPKSNARISNFLIEKGFPFPLTSMVTDYLCLKDIINTQDVVTDNQVSINGYISTIDLNLTDKPYNLLYNSVNISNMAAVRLLIELGANPNHPLTFPEDRFPQYIGKSILDYAREVRKDMVPLLEEGLPK